MLDELNEYSALLIEPYYYKPLRPYLPKDAVTHAAFTTKYCTKYYMALLMELSSIGGAAGLALPTVLSVSTRVDSFVFF